MARVVHPLTAAGGVAQQLRERILAGDLRPGMTLPPERVLADQLAVSRATLREGLSMLAQIGLVAIQRGRSGGAVVTAPPVETVSASIALLFRTRVVTAGQVCQFRRAIEVEAAELAATRGEPAAVATIAVAYDAYIASGGDQDRQNDKGRAFHYAVARASGNPLLAQTLLSLNDAFATCFALQHPGPDPAPLIAEFHEPILMAIRQRDAAGARQAMILHFVQLEQALHDLDITERPIGGRPTAMRGGEVSEQGDW